MSRPKTLRAWLALLLALCGAVYAPAACNGFAYDDAIYAKVDTPHGRNVMVAALRPLHEYLQVPYGYPMTGHSRNFRPATTYSFALTHAAFAGRGPGAADPAWPHHVLNVALHALAAWLAYQLLVLAGAAGWPALLGAATFGLHALRSDVVASIAGRAELLAFTGGAAAAVLFVRAQRSTGVAFAWRLAAVALLVVVALLAKESAVSWLVFLPLFVLVAPHGAGESCRPRLVRLLATLAVLLPPLVLFVVLRERMLAVHGATFEVVERQNPLFYAAAAERTRTATMLVAYGLGKVLAPFWLSCEYGTRVFEPVTSWADLRFWATAALLAALFAGGCLAWRRAPLLFLAMATFAGFLFPVSNLPVPIETMFAERLYYTPALGLSFVVAWLARAPLGPRARLVAGVALAVWLAANAWVCLLRSFDWRSNETLFLADSQTQPRSVFLNLHAASIWAARGDAARQELHLRRVLAVEPNLPLALAQQAELCMRSSRLQEAALLYDRALSSPALRDVEKPPLRYARGVLWQRLGRAEEARKDFEMALSLDPASPAAADARSALLWQAQAAGDARHVERLLSDGLRWLPRLDPASESAAVLRLFAGQQALDAGRPAEALRAWDASLRLLETRAPPASLAPFALAYARLLAGAGRRLEARECLARLRGERDLTPALREELDRLAREMDG